MQIINHHIDQGKHDLLNKWMHTIENIITTAGSKRRHVPDQKTQKKRFHTFIEAINALLSHQLQLMCLKTIEKLVQFLSYEMDSNDSTNSHYPGFVLYLSVNEGNINYLPKFDEFESNFLSIFDAVVATACSFPRIEHKLFPDWRCEKLSNLRPIILPEIVSQAKIKVTNVIQKQSVLPNDFLATFNKYQFIINKHIQEDATTFLTENRTFHDYSIKVENYYQLIQTITSEAVKTNHLGYFEVWCGDLIERLIAETDAVKENVLRRMIDDEQELCRKLCEDFADTAKRLLIPPVSTQQLSMLKNLIDTVESETISKFAETLKEICNRINFLVDYVTFSIAEINVNVETFIWLSKMSDVIKNSKKLLLDKTEEFEENLKVNRLNFIKELDEYAKMVEEFTLLSDMNEIKSYLTTAQNLNQKLEEAEAKVTLFNMEETIFGWATTTYPQRLVICEKLSPYLRLYETAVKFEQKHKEWLESPLTAINPDLIEQEIAAIWRSIYKLERSFADIPVIKILIQKMKVRVEELKEQLPLVKALCNLGLRDRHWEQIGEIVGFPLKPDQSTTLSKIIDLNLNEFVPRFENISDAASKEHSLEKTWQKMFQEWENMEFCIITYRETGTCILSSMDDIQQLLDDHIVKTEAMKSSPFVKPFEKEIANWDSTLTRLQEIIDEWLKVQSTWMYLESIFASPDIMSQMPEEGRRFNTVDKHWRDIMKVAITDKHVLVVMKMERLLDRLKKSNDLLDVIQKGLNDYLEKKRLLFPRFFFLSNDELLEILSETKNPSRVQPHLRKCFEGIHRLEFEDSYEITHIVSCENESVELCHSVITSKARGHVEVWLYDLEQNMLYSISKIIADCVDDYKSGPDEKWLFNWPGQAILCVSQLMWTAEVHQRLHDKQALRQYYNSSSKKIEDIVSHVRQEHTQAERLTLGSLVMMEVHGRDIVNLLIDDNSDLDDSHFSWISQLRYYLDEDGAAVKMMNTSLKYGCEYLGNTSRLVITPLTDRCYRTLFAALHLHLGCALEGPAGAGKTETTKDLAKAVAKHCVVFNCSDSMDYVSLGKFFKGLAACGAWSCFDEFNRIDLEVLSVVAQQIMTIQRGIHSHLGALYIGGTEVKLDPTCAVFVTMNPGYSGRAELPDNLKALFRPVAMVIPDYAMIAEIALYSFGLVKAHDLAVKMVSLYRLCAEHLSSQSHYDYGMRAIKSVLFAVENLKMENPEEDEEAIVLRAIRNVNLPKFLSVDVPRFNNILSDLFPNVKLSHSDFTVLINEIKLICENNNLQCTPYFIEKIIQVYETIGVRHGLMIVGGPYAGKTSIYRTLAEALGNLCAKNLANENRVQLTLINPKAISIGRLYGQFDSASYEWTDGILAVAFRNYATSSSPDRKWIVFDGPVDATWIENMNTVLDDNRKLCLMSGEVIAMPCNMNLIFETTDLEFASPATVSRCGMVYVEPALLGWNPVVVSWFNTWPSNLTAEHKDHVQILFDYFCPPLLYMLRHSGIKELATSTDISLVASLIRLLSCFLNELEDPAFVKTLGKEDIFTFLSCAFLFSCIWSLGGCVDEDGRSTFDLAIRNLLAMKLLKWMRSPSVSEETIDGSEALHYMLPIPKSGTVYDYKFVYDNKRQWILWSETLKQFPAIPRDSLVHQIIVPTADTACYSSLISMLISHGKPAMLVGPAGTGKTVLITNLLKNFIGNQYKTLTVNFSANCSSSVVQDIIMSKVDKRRKGVYGPPVGKKMVIFIDDLNLPVPEECGAQPPIELLRLLLDDGSLFDCKDNNVMKLFDLQLVAAMGPTGGGRNCVSSRFLRHFNVISMNRCSNEAMKTIFGKVLLWHLDTRGFSKDFDPCIEQLVNGTIAMHTYVYKTFLPTPTRSHYQFNLRDVCSIMQGVLFSCPETMEDIRSMKRLWTHEILRVYYDRLVDFREKVNFIDTLKNVIQADLKDDFNELFSSLCTNPNKQVSEQDLRSLFFCDFSDPKSDLRNYVEVQDFDNLKNVVEGYLEEYNNVSKKPMDIVMFRFAIEHLSRISRILKQPRGNALLVGLGGSGRQSLTRLVAHISDYELHQLEISRTYSLGDWKEDLKRVLIKTASDEKQHIFLLADTQIKDDTFLDDINNLLNSGEVPNLFNNEEKQEISEKIREIDRQKEFPKNPAVPYELFLETVRDSLHAVITMSPAGDKFRERLRKYPALVNCCTVDWFQPWPEDALQAVAYKFFTSMNMTEDEQEKCSILCQIMHNSARSLSQRFFKEMKRPTYITPTSYTDLLRTFKHLLNEQRSETIKARQRYEMGIEKLDSAATQVTTMQEELSILQPQLIEASKEVDDIMVIVEKDSLEVAEVEKIVKTDEAFANRQTLSAQAIKEECDQELEKAIPMLNSALEALNTLTSNDITILKTMKNPPNGVKLVMESICILKGVKNDRIVDPSGSGKMIDDYWGPSKRLLSEMKFLESLSNFDKDNIQAKTMKIIREKYITNPEFDPEKIKMASAAAEGLCKWVIAMEIYDRVIKEVAPKREALAVAEADLSVAQTALEEKQANLREVQSKLQELTEILEKNKQRKMELETQVDQCTLKLERAQQLLNRLGGERTRWSEMATHLGEKYVFLTGNMLLSAGIIAYLGPFTASYRRNTIKKWMELFTKEGLPCSPNFTLASALGDPVTIQAWKIAELPVDSFSVDNAIIITKAKSHKWPLIIDPQNQANRWIRNMEKSSGLKILKTSDPDHLRLLEVCIQTGKPVLLENVGDEIDQALEAVLLKQTFKHAGSMCMKVGENIVEYSPSFSLYLTSHLTNPHYLPETAMKVSLVNFMITPSGLEEQLLGLIVAREKPDLEEEEKLSFNNCNPNCRQLKEIEDKILEVLSTAQGNILDDETAIKVLSSSKILANEIIQKQASADVTEKKIEESRQSYRPIASHVSAMYFTVANLSSVDHMYQFSLPWFINLFLLSIDNTEKLDDLELRLTELKEHFIMSLYETVCQGLLEKDKLLFAFLLAVNQMKIDNKLNDDEWNLLLSGGATIVDTSGDQSPSWLPQCVWDWLTLLETRQSFTGLKSSIRDDEEIWKDFYLSNSDEDAFWLPLEWENKLSEVQKLILFRYLCPYKVVPFMKELVRETLGSKYVDAPPLNIGKAFADSSCNSPIIFLLTPGVDPMNSLLNFSEEMGFGGARFNSLSLGQGQGPIALEMVQESAKAGLWVVLQNCHLAKSWMPELEKLCEDLNPETTHPDFRLWLTSYSRSYFPIGVLKAGIKVTNEATSGFRASLTRYYLGDPLANPDTFNSFRTLNPPDTFQKLVFALCCFHTVVKERRDFGSLGWNMPYEFNDNDLYASIHHLVNCLEHSQKSISMQMFLYIVGVCTYGGRVTDPWDVRTLDTLIHKCISSTLIEKHDYLLGVELKILFPEDGKYDSYLELIKDLPSTTYPEIVGLHSNARIATANAATNTILEDLYQTQLGVMQHVYKAGSQPSQSTDTAILETVYEILSRLSPDFEVETLSEDSCMRTFLLQEMERYNGLLKTIKQSLHRVEKAVKGLVVMSSDIEDIVTSILKGTVPKLWLQKSYPSLKKLGNYIQDLLKRLELIKEWSVVGCPKVIWISGLFFIHAFITTILQHYARKRQISMELLELHVEIMDETDYNSSPEDGVYVKGLYLEGARWDKDSRFLAESHPKQLNDYLPVLWLKPVLKGEIDKKLQQGLYYNCPVYQTSQRWGQMTTTGLSSNYIFSAWIPSSVPKEHWICRGVAILCQLD
ncbi:Dynein heavy chain 7, axonemal [Chamberlinius hualienensis]